MLFLIGGRRRLRRAVQALQELDQPGFEHVEADKVTLWVGRQKFADQTPALYCRKLQFLAEGFETVFVQGLRASGVAGDEEGP